MTPARIAHLRALCDAATKGPWKVFNATNVTAHNGAVHVASTGLPINARFAREARTALPEALDAIELLRKALAATIESSNALLMHAKANGWDGMAPDDLAWVKDAIPLIAAATGQALPPKKETP
jgi:hypothetical protein